MQDLMQVRSVEDVLAPFALPADVIEMIDLRLITDPD